MSGEALSEQAVATIKRFVAGEISPPDFRDSLYRDKSMEAVLTNDPKLRPENYVSACASVFHYLIELDFDDPGDVLDAQGALCEFFDRNGIEYSKTDKYSDWFDLVLASQPDWLQVEPKFVMENMIPESGGKTGKELQTWLEGEFLKRFRCLSAPPSWIQNPDWPFVDGRPTIFVGQFDVPADSGFFHDDASFFVFWDPDSDQTRTVIQVA